MTKQEIQKLVANMDDEALNNLTQAAAATIEERRPRVKLSDIKPGMSKETEQAVWAEIQRALKDV